MFPLVVHTMDLVVSAAGTLSVGAKSSVKPSQAIEDPYDVIKVGVLSLHPFHSLCLSSICPALL